MKNKIERCNAKTRKGTFLEVSYHECCLPKNHIGKHRCRKKLEDWSIQQLKRTYCTYKWYNRNVHKEK
jgi:hypothetical protein